MQRSRSVKKLKRIPSFFLITLVKVYQIFISPVFPPCCRFTPICSTYAIDAIYKYGVMRGLFFASRRILRCNPFCEGGNDPVP